ncbi:hypothetical protein LguiB_032210 [Lonicera macranthoides]
MPATTHDVSWEAIALDDISSIVEMIKILPRHFINRILKTHGAHTQPPCSLFNRPTMSDNPEDVLADIVSRLPVKSLLQFTCISKSWRDLIGSKDFIKLHLTRATETNINCSIIIRECCSLYSINFNSFNNAIRLNPPLNLHDQTKMGTRLIGSCNGLLCLTNTEKYIFLWNPSTRTYRRSPVSRILLGVEFVVSGFGYDDVTDDYIVVRIVQFYGRHEDSVRPEVSLYSMKSDSWRRIGDFPYY